MDSFTNDVLEASSLPRYEAVPFTAIHPKYREIIVINFLASLVIFGLVTGIALYFIEYFQPYFWIGLLAYLMLMLCIFLLQLKSFKSRGYAIREHDIIYTRGVVSKITTIIPFNRIQNIALNESFLSRRYGLAQLHVFTAGGTSSDIRLPGLLKTDAQNIKEMILQQIVKEENVADQLIAD